MVYKDVWVFFMLNYGYNEIIFLGLVTSNNNINGKVVILISIFAIVMLYIIFKYTNIFKRIFFDEGTDDVLNEIVEISGYAYNPEQDIFYSRIDAWQRDFGYCRLYDEGAAPLGMIIDCEPIYFQYDDRRWLIELWKGQYALTTGGEIGVYVTEGPDLDIPDFFNGTFYNCVSDDDILKMSYSLEKNGNTLFTREDKHWWLTGFMIGEFSEPSELIMELNITLKDERMRDAFVKGLKNANYLDDEIFQNGNTVSIVFSKTHVEQPFTRTEETDWVIQRKNEGLCNEYQNIAKDYKNTPDKLRAIRKEAPEIYKEVINIGKTRNIYDIYTVIKNYLV